MYNGVNAMSSTVHRWTIQCVIVVLSVVMACSTAWALSLGDAKDRGLVGERLSGYLGAVSGKASSDVQSLIDNVNQQRKQLYQQIAKRNKTNLKAVEMLAGKTAMKKTKPGNYIQLPSGQWTKKEATR